MMAQPGSVVDPSKEVKVEYSVRPREKRYLVDDMSGDREEEEYSVRPMEEGEKKILLDLVDLADDAREYKWSLRKSLYWESLQWSPLDKAEQDLFATKSIYLQVQLTKKQDSCLWYAVPIKDLFGPGPGPGGDGDGEELHPALGAKPHILQRTVAYPPDHIIAFGGSSPREVSCLNVREKEPAWMPGPSMKTARRDPTVVVLEGRIYVFGGCISPLSMSDVERFDKHLDVWDELNYEGMIDSDGNIPGVFSQAGGGVKHLAFYSFSSRSVSVFNVETGAVTFGERVFPDMYNGCVVVDGYLYAHLYHTNDVRAYDLLSKQWLPGPVIDSSFFGPHPMKRLIHIGGNFLCVIEDDEKYAGWHSRPLLLRFRVFRVDRDREMNCRAELISSRSYLFRRGFKLYDSLIL